MELIASDLKIVLEMMKHLDKLASIEGTHEVEIRFRTDGDDWITVGYGESGDPAVLNIEPETKTNVITPNPSVWTINRQDVGFQFDRPLGESVGSFDFNTLYEDRH